MLVTVVIPSYNHRDYVLQAIESVLDQSWPQVDLIVIDDGSRDGSPEAIQKLLERRGGFRFVARGNRGLLKTLNEGLDMARGEFFCELASDDYFPSDSLEKRARFLREHPDCVAVFGDGYIIKGNIQTDEAFCDEKRRRMFTKEDPIPDMLKGILPVFSTGLIRANVLRNLGGFDSHTYRYYEDLEVPLKLCLLGKIGYLDTPVIFRREHETNVSKTTQHVRVEKVACYLKLLKDPAFFNYHGILYHRLKSELLKLGRYLDQAGGSSEEYHLFNQSWRYVLHDPRLLWYFIKLLGRKVINAS